MIIMFSYISFQTYREFISDRSWTNLVEHSSESLISGILSLGLLLSLLFSGSWGSLGGSNRCGGSVGVWVGNAVLQLINLSPAVFGSNGNGQNVLVAVDNRVHNRWKSWEVGSQGDSSNGGDGTAESLEKLGLLNVENTWWESVTIIVNLGDTHTICERRDVQHVKKGSLGSSDLGTSLNELQVSGNFNGTTGNLGWDTESLEERGLSWFHTSVTGWDVDIGRGNGTSSGWSSNLVVEDLVTNGLEVIVGEDETDVTLDERKETFVFWVVANETLDGTADLFK